MWIDVKEYDAVGDGTTDDSTVLQSLITKIGSFNTWVYFSAETAEVFDGASTNGGTYKISSDLTFPANVGIIFGEGASLSIDSGVTVTINGKIQTLTKLSECFSGLGSYVYNGENRLDMLESIDADDIDDSTTVNKFVTAADLTNLSNLSGINTGDQDLSTYVEGPASSTDNAIARFDLTTGKLIQNSNVTINDAGSVNIPGYLSIGDNLYINEALSIYFGSDNDAYLMHLGDFEFLNNTGDCYFYSSNINKSMKFDGVTGAVELYYNNVKKLETTTNGATITGNITADNMPSIDTANTLPATGWVANTGDYAYKYNFADANITANDMVIVSIDVDDLDTAEDAGIAPVVDSYAGGITFYAIATPSASMTFDYTIVRG
jgi:hypothetical protein